MTETKTLHIKLKLINDDLVRFHCYIDNPNKITTQNLRLSKIDQLITAAKMDYYQPPQEFCRIGQQLYQWLDGPNRLVSSAVKDCRPADVIALAIETEGKLSHLPWEVLHNGNCFLVEQLYPLLVPVRRLDDKRVPYKSSNRPLQVLFMAASPMDTKPVLDFEQEEGLILDATSHHPLNLTVEESGNLEELRHLIDAYESGWFDILHLSGHAKLTKAGGRFLTIYNRDVYAFILF
jgi:hypothetical protein